MQENDPFFESEKIRKPWAERHGFPPWVVVFGWVISALILFQLGALVIMMIILLLDPTTELSQEVFVSMDNYLGHLFLANTFSQILFLGLGSWMVALLSTTPRQRMAFFRMTKFADTGKASLITALLIFTIQPLVWLLSWINMQVPVPDSLILAEEEQMKMIENFLRSDHFLLLTLFHIAVIPAICEEIMYRGYIMRMLENNWGIIAAIIVSGFIFGAYHLRVTQVLPLASIGMLLAYATYKSGSLIPAIVGHFVNNAASVVAATYYPDLVFEEYGQTFLPSFQVVLVSALLTGALLYLMHTQISGTETSTSGGTNYV